MRVVGEVNKYLVRPGAVEAQGRREPERLAHGPARRGAGGQRLPTRCFAVPAAQRAARCTRRSAARATSSPHAARSARSTTSTAARGYPVITGDYRAGLPAWESRRRSWPARRCRQPSPVFPSSTPRWSTRSWPGCAAEAGRARDRRGSSAPACAPPPPEPLPHPGRRQPHPPRHRPRRRGARSPTADAVDRARPPPSASTGWCRSAATCEAAALDRRALDEPMRRRCSAASRCTRTRRRGWRRAAGCLDAALAEIERLAPHPRVRVIGETGSRLLPAPAADGARGRTRSSFRWHIDLAKRTGQGAADPRPDAHDDVLRILAEEGAPERTVFHCFSGDAAMARAAPTAASTSRSPAPSRSRTPRACATRCASCRWTGSWSRPTRPTSRRRRYRGRPTPAYLVPLTVRAMADELGRDLEALCRRIDATSEAVYGPW